MLMAETARKILRKNSHDEKECEKNGSRFKELKARVQMAKFEQSAEEKALARLLFRYLDFLLACRYFYYFSLFTRACRRRFWLLIFSWRRLAFTWFFVMTRIRALRQILSISRLYATDFWEYFYTAGVAATKISLFGVSRLAI